MRQSAPERWAELARRIENREPAAEEELARVFFPHLLAMAASRLHDRESARDLAQEAFLAVLSAVREGRLREPEKLSSFVVGTGRNTISNHLRDQWRHPRPLSFGSQEAKISDPGSEAGDRSREENERRDIVLSALQGLKPVDRGILFLTLVEGLNPREIAVELELRPQVVRLRKSRALGRLRRKFDRMIRKGRLNY